MQTKTSVHCWLMFSVVAARWRRCTGRPGQVLGRTGEAGNRHCLSDCPWLSWPSLNTAKHTRLSAPSDNLFMGVFVLYRADGGAWATACPVDPAWRMDSRKSTVDSGQTGSVDCESVSCKYKTDGRGTVELRNPLYPGPPEPSQGRSQEPPRSPPRVSQCSRLDKKPR